MEAVPTERLILVVEHDPDHARQIESALNESGIDRRIVTIADGKRTLDFLYRRGEFVEALRPDLILLDLNVSDGNGRELLANVKADPQLRRIPIVILTTSKTEEDIFRTYTLQGNCYVVKSSDLDQLFRIVKRIDEFWLGIVTLPVE